MNKQQAITIAKEAINTAIKNSDIVAPYVKPKHYRRGMIVLNVLHFALRFLEKKE